jgi:hypothetical protein
MLCEAKGEMDQNCNIYQMNAVQNLNIRWMTYAWSRMFSYITFLPHSKHCVFNKKSNQYMFYSDTVSVNLLAPVFYT